MINERLLAEEILIELSTVTMSFQKDQNTIISEFKPFDANYIADTLDKNINDIALMNYYRSDIRGGAVTGLEAIVEALAYRIKEHFHKNFKLDDLADVDVINPQNGVIYGLQYYNGMFTTVATSGGSGGGINGSGTPNYVTKFINTSGGIGDSQIYDDGTRVSVGTSANTFSRMLVKVEDSTGVGVALTNNDSGGNPDVQIGMWGANKDEGYIKLGMSAALYASHDSYLMSRFAVGTSEGNLSKVNIHDEDLNETAIQFTNGATGYDDIESGMVVGIDNEGGGFIRYNGYGDFDIFTSRVSGYEEPVLRFQNFYRNTILGFTSGNVYLQGITFLDEVDHSVITSSKILTLGNSNEIEYKNISELVGEFDLSQYYTKTELQTSGQAIVDWGNITNVPSFEVSGFGSGTPNYVTKFINTSGGIGDSQIYDDGTRVSVGTSANTFSRMLVKVEDSTGVGIALTNNDSGGNPDVQIGMWGANKDEGYIKLSMSAALYASHDSYLMSRFAVGTSEGNLSKVNIHDEDWNETAIQFTNGATGYDDTESGMVVGVDYEGGGFIRYNGYGDFDIFTSRVIGSEESVLSFQNFYRNTILGFTSGNVYLNGTTYLDILTSASSSKILVVDNNNKICSATTSAIGIQPLDPTLTALAELNTTTGFIYQTGIDTFTKYGFGGTGTATTVSRSDHNHSGTYEPAITSGLSTQYWRGDKTWQVLNTGAVAESTNLYFTTARVASYLTGAISDILTSNLTANRVLLSDSSGKVSTSSITATELGYLSGVTSSIQTQLDGKLSGSGTTGRIPYFTSGSAIGNSTLYINGKNLGIYHESPSWSNSYGSVNLGINAIWGYTNIVDGYPLNISNNRYNDGTDKPLQNGGSLTFSLADRTFRWYIDQGLTAGVAFTPTERMMLNAVDGLFLDNLTASRVLIADQYRFVKSSSVTTTELSYLSGVSSAIQTQLNDKVALYGLGIAGRMPYFYSGTQLANSNLYISGGRHIGFSQAPAAWGSSYGSIDIGLNAIWGYTPKYDGFPLNISNNRYNDGTNDIPYVSGSSLTYALTDRTFRWYINTGLTSGVAFTPTQVMRLGTSGLQISTLATSSVVVNNSSGYLESSSVTPTELGYLSGKTSVIDGSGTIGYIPMFSGANRLTNSAMYTSGITTTTNGRHQILYDCPDTQYNNTNLELICSYASGSKPSIGFHRSGYDAMTLLYAGGRTLQVRDVSNATLDTIWHSGNDGSGSGLDADLLDGYHLNQLTKSISNSGNLNLTNNISNINSFYATLNGPMGNNRWYWSINASHGIGDTTWGGQIVWGMEYSAYRNRMFFHSKEGSVWDDWTEILTNRLIGSRETWATYYSSTFVVGQLTWENYGNNHTIFDASRGYSPSGTVIDNSNSQVAWVPTYPTLMGWNGSETYGVRVDSARVADDAGALGGYLPSNYLGKNGTSHYQSDGGWIQFPGTQGLYNPYSGSGIRLYSVDSSLTYGSHTSEGSKNGWAGLAFASSSTKITFMTRVADSFTGVYQQSNSIWQWYHDGSQFWINTAGGDGITFFGDNAYYNHIRAMGSDNSSLFLESNAAYIWLTSVNQADPYPIQMSRSVEIYENLKVDGNYMSNVNVQGAVFQRGIYTLKASLGTYSVWCPSYNVPNLLVNSSLWNSSFYVNSYSPSPGHTNGIISMGYTATEGVYQIILSTAVKLGAGVNPGSDVKIYLIRSRSGSTDTIMVTSEINVDQAYYYSVSGICFAELKIGDIIDVYVSCSNDNNTVVFSSIHIAFTYVGRCVSDNF